MRRSVAATCFLLKAAFGLEAEMLLGMQTDHSLARARARQAEITAEVAASTRPRTEAIG